MSDHEPGRLTPEEQRARDAVRALRTPAADPAFRARLAREFAAGTIAPALRPAPEVPGAAIVLGRQRAWWVPAVPVAVAAAIVVTIAALNRGPAWQVTGSTGDGIAIVGNQPVPIHHLDELSEMIRPGMRVRVPDGTTLELMSAGGVAIQLESGTDVTMPAAPARWFGRESNARIAAGELRITTGARFHGAKLAIATPEAHVMVTGTTLAVICEPRGTCVCVFEGTVRVGDASGSMVPVDAGHRRYVFNDGRGPEQAAIRDAEHVKLGAFRDEMRVPLGGK